MKKPAIIAMNLEKLEPGTSEKFSVFSKDALTEFNTEWF
jgi:hypothetical protein